jgi:hypothetical protein
MRTIALVALLSACGSREFADCAGDHAGTYEGSDQGSLAGTLEPNGKVELTFDSDGDGPSFGASGKVEPGGDVGGSSLIVAWDGQLDMITCASSGTWTNNTMGLSGTWELDLQ